MIVSRLVRCFFLLFAVIFSEPAPLCAATAEPVELYKAFYLERQEKDFAAARTLYEAVAGKDLPADLKRIASAGAARCRDNLAAENFVSLMPPETLGYVELSRPGQIVGKLAEMLGLTGPSVAEVLARRPSAASSAPIHVPQEVVISPALLAALGRFGGLAVGITSFVPNEARPPSGLFVLHHGDADLLKGILETAFQFAPTAEKIRDLPTFGAKIDETTQIVGVLTESLLFVGTGRELVDGAVARLLGESTSSLAAREDVSEILSQRAGSTLFAFADLQAILKIVRLSLSEGDAREMDVLNAVADLDSLRWAALTVGVKEQALGLQFVLRLADGHHNMLYNLLRLPPMSRRCLHYVPSDAAAVVGLGLNPAAAGAVIDSAQRAAGGTDVTGFDVGREFFGNIHEICAFVVPGRMSASDGGAVGPIPNAAVILAVNDPARSKALWSQLLSIPGLVAGDKPIQPEPVKVAGVEATAYAIPQVGKVYLAEFEGCLAIAATRNALRAAIRASGKAASVLEDALMGTAIGRLPEDTSLMFVANAGRIARVVADGREAAEAIALTQASELCANTVVSVGVGPSPSRLTLRASASGLPNVNEALRKYGPLVNAFAQFAGPSHRKKAVHSPPARRPRPEREPDTEPD